jgi:dienelactone hydrolase
MQNPIRLAAAAALLTAGVAAAQLEETPVYPDRTNLLVLKDESGGEKPIQIREEWELRRRQILKNMEKVMGPIPQEAGAKDRSFRRKVPLDLKVESEEQIGSYSRLKISYVSRPTERIPAFLLVPRRRKGKLPAVLALHQTVPQGKEEPVGITGSKDLKYAADLATRGYVVLVPDYPGFGENKPESEQETYWTSNTMKAIWQNLRGVRLLQSLPMMDGKEFEGMPEVDRDRIGAIGHSLGGHNAIFTAAFVPDIRVVVSNCGFTSFTKYMGGDLTGWTGPAYMPKIKTDFPTPDKMPFDFQEVIAALAPRPFLAIAPKGDSNFDVSGVQDVIAAAKPVYKLFGEPDRLKALYPNVGHEWPRPMRKAAYEWLDRWLKY